MVTWVGKQKTTSKAKQAMIIISILVDSSGLGIAKNHHIRRAGMKSKRN